MKRIPLLCIFLSLLMLLLSLSGCQKPPYMEPPTPVDSGNPPSVDDGPSDPVDSGNPPSVDDGPSDPVDSGNSPEQKNVSVDLSGYAIVRSGGASDYTMAGIQELRDSLSAIFNKSFSVRSDKLVLSGKGEDAPKEILVGVTNRSASAEALAALGDRFAYSITVAGNTISILGATPELTQKAMDTFLSFCRAETTEGTVITLPEQMVSLPLPYTELILGGTSRYKLIYAQKDVGNENFQVFKAFMESYNKFTKDPVEFGDDWLPANALPNDDAKEIVVGNTDYPLSAQLLSGEDLYSWALSQKEAQIYAAAIEPEALKAVCDRLLERMRNGILYTDNTTVRIGVITETLREKLSGAVVGSPYFDGGSLISAKEFSKGFVRKYYENASREEFDAYLQKLEAHGYVRYSRDTADNNEYHTLYKDDRMIHVYYLNADQTVRVISASAEDAIPFPKEPTSDGTVTTPALAMADMDYVNQLSGHNRGMGFVFTLADGSYVIIDGGYGTEAEPLYRYLSENNKRADGKIRIRAWILTHPDGDHYECFLEFAKRYASEVTLDYWVAQVSTELIFNTHMDSIDPLFAPDDPDRPTYTPGKSQIFDGAPIVRALDKALARFENVTRIVPMTGQTMYFGDLKMQFVYTGEMLYPKEVSRGATTNEHSLVMKIWFEDSTLLITGDVLHKGMEVMVKYYTNALKADFIQAPHHGLQGTMKFYNKVDAKYLVMCTDEASCADRFMEDFNTRKSKNDLYALTTKVKENGEKQIEYVFLADNSENGFIPMMLGSEIIFSDMK